MAQVPGSLDAWLLLRSLRTLNIRIQRQSKTATALASWLNSLTSSNHANSNEEEGNGTKGIVHKVFHTSLQENASDLLSEDGTKQMTSGPPCFGVLLEKDVYAEYLPSRLKLFFVSWISLSTSIGARLTRSPALILPTECYVSRRCRIFDRAKKGL